MSRSQWKADIKYNKQLNKNNKTIKLYSRNIKITEDLIDYTFLVYTGNNFRKVKIKQSMLGHKMGEFAPTRKKPLFEKVKQRKIKRK